MALVKYHGLEVVDLIVDRRLMKLSVPLLVSTRLDVQSQSRIRYLQVVFVDARNRSSQ